MQRPGEGCARGNTQECAVYRQRGVEAGERLVPTGEPAAEYGDGARIVAGQCHAQRLKLGLIAEVVERRMLGYVVPVDEHDPGRRDSVEYGRVDFGGVLLSGSERTRGK